MQDEPVAVDVRAQVSDRRGVGPRCPPTTASANSAVATARRSRTSARSTIAARSIAASPAPRPAGANRSARRSDGTAPMRSSAATTAITRASGGRIVDLSEISVHKNLLHRARRAPPMLRRRPIRPSPRARQEACPMLRPKLVIKPSSTTTRMLLMYGDEEVLRAQLPMPSTLHPRAAPTLCEALSLWLGRPAVHCAVCGRRVLRPRWASATASASGCRARRSKLLR